MAEITLFECDVTGERFGAKNDVVTIGVKRRWSNDPFSVHEYDVHLSDEAVEDSDVSISQLQHLEYVCLDGREIVGAATKNRDGDPVYRERDDVVMESNEPAFEFLEEEVIV